MRQESHSRAGLTRADAVVLFAIAALGFGLLAPALQGARKADERAVCTNNLKQIGQAVLKYEATHRHTPPASVFREAGRRSWATYVLPQLGEEKLARQYRGDHDWYDKQNAAAVKTQIKLFRCPSAPTHDASGKISDSDWAAATGDYAATRTVGMAAVRGMGVPAEFDRAGLFPKDKTRTLAEVTDGQAHTLMLVECAGRPQSWIKGKRQEADQDAEQGVWAGRRFDIEVKGHAADGVGAPGPCGVNCSNKGGVYSFHTGIANVCFIDGSVRPLREGMDAHVLFALVTIRGGEPVSAGDY